MSRLAPRPRPAAIESSRTTSRRTRGGRRSASSPIGLLAFVAGAVIGARAWAGDDRLLPVDTPKAYVAECGACHVPYPPKLLPAASWQRLIAGLDHHFGSDAGLDAETAKRLSGWLQAQAGSDAKFAKPSGAGSGAGSGASPPERITTTAWFTARHRELGAAWRSDPAIGSPANCAACHPGADRGDYDDDRLRLPASLRSRHGD